MVFVYGKGKRKPEIQQLYEELEHLGQRLMEYKESFEIRSWEKTGTAIPGRTWKLLLCG